MSQKPEPWWPLNRQCPTTRQDVPWWADLHNHPFIEEVWAMKDGNMRFYPKGYTTPVFIYAVAPDDMLLLRCILLELAYPGSNP